MKRTVLLFFLVASSQFIFGQSLTLSYPEGNIPDGGSVIFTTTANTPIMSGQKLIFVHNNSATDANVLCTKEIIDTIPGTQNSFCWGLCYADTVYNSLPLYPVFIAAGDSTDQSGFSGEYNPNGHVGDSHVRYIFTNKDNHSESVSVVVTYRATPVSVCNYNQNSDKMTTAPNPASNQTTVDYCITTANGNLTLIIKNLLGAVVYSSDLSGTAGRTSINTSDFTDGIYFISILSNNRPLNSKKLVVRH
jgi:hypothetical protein